MPCEVVITRFRTTQPIRDSSPCSYQICGSLQATSSCNLYDKMHAGVSSGGLDGIHVPHVDVFSQVYCKVWNEHTLSRSALATQVSAQPYPVPTS
jgi:hypothetical protein